MAIGQPGDTVDYGHQLGLVEVNLDALGAERILDPTSAGDLCRSFSEPDVLTLMDTINEARLRVWARQPPEFLAEAVLEADGTIVPSDAECKRGMDFAYDGRYSYHPSCSRRSVCPSRIWPICP
jgi:hypothetical protein